MIDVEIRDDVSIPPLPPSSPPRSRSPSPRPATPTPPRSNTSTPEPEEIRIETEPEEVRILADMLPDTDGDTTVEVRTENVAL